MIRVLYFILASFLILILTAGKVTIESSDRILSLIFIICVFNTLQIYQLSRSKKEQNKPKEIKLKLKPGSYYTIGNGLSALCVKKIKHNEFLMKIYKKGEAWLVDNNGKALYGKSSLFDVLL
ncbi:MAG: hypothetical protein NC222_07000 [Staphylococcus sp.]|nr:hypothetical protein [Staphylococcus sp.]